MGFLSDVINVVCPKCGALFEPPEVRVEPDTSKEDADKESNKRRKKIRQSRKDFQKRASTRGPIQLQAPALGGL